MYNKAILYDPDLAVKEILELLDEVGISILIFVDKKDILIGIVTDGDARRGILNNKKILKDIINFNPSTLMHTDSKNKIKNYLQNIHRRSIPLVDENNRYKSIFSLDDLEFIAYPNWVVIMAGGLGSRLGELTKNVPKPMLKVGEKPILEEIINNFISYGFHNFYISINYKKEIIKDYFKDGSEFGANIKYLEEDMKLGTAGSLSLIKEKLNEPILVSNGDVLTNIDFEELLSYHLDKKSIATMCVREHKHIIPYGVVDTDGYTITSLREKPEIEFRINSGVYVLDPNVVKKIPKDTFFDMPTLFESLIKEREMPFYYSIKDYWIDVGHINEYMKANDDFKI